MEIDLRKIAILLSVAIAIASAQCIAACGILPCNESAEQHQSAPVEDCHHRKAPPSDKDHGNTTCGHQVFVSDVGPQASPMVLHLAVVAIIAVNVMEPLPQSPLFVDAASDSSPPPPSDLAFRTILRV